MLIPEAAYQGLNPDFITYSATFTKLLNPSVLSFVCKMGTITVYLISLVWELSEMIYVKHSAPCLAQGEPSKRMNYCNFSSLWIFLLLTTLCSQPQSWKRHLDVNVLKASQVSFFILLGVSMAEWQREWLWNHQKKVRVKKTQTHSYL